jgi:hypothetical protein
MPGSSSLGISGLSGRTPLGYPETWWAGTGSSSRVPGPRPSPADPSKIFTAFERRTEYYSHTMDDRRWQYKSSVIPPSSTIKTFADHTYKKI